MVDCPPCTLAVRNDLKIAPKYQYFCVKPTAWLLPGMHLHVRQAARKVCLPAWVLMTRFREFKNPYWYLARILQIFSACRAAHTWALLIPVVGYCRYSYTYDEYDGHQSYQYCDRLAAAFFPPPGQGLTNETLAQRLHDGRLGSAIQSLRKALPGPSSLIVATS